jgi:hypothetical protein
MDMEIRKNCDKCGYGARTLSNIHNHLFDYSPVSHKDILGQ